MSIDLMFNNGEKIRLVAGISAFRALLSFSTRGSSFLQAKAKFFLKICNSACRALNHIFVGSSFLLVFCSHYSGKELKGLTIPLSGPVSLYMRGHLFC